MQSAFSERLSLHISKRTHRTLLTKSEDDRVSVTRDKSGLENQSLQVNSTLAKGHIEATISITTSVSNHIQDIGSTVTRAHFTHFFIHSQLSDIIPATTLQDDTASRHYT